MGIFDGVEKTLAQRKYEAIKEKAPKILDGERNRCKAMFDELWQGTMADAQAVLDLFGTEAVNLFTYHSAWQTFLASVDSNYEWLTPPYNITVNEDGTVTLSEKPSDPEPQS